MKKLHITTAVILGIMLAAVLFQHEYTLVMAGITAWSVIGLAIVVCLVRLTTVAGYAFASCQGMEEVEQQYADLILKEYRAITDLKMNKIIQRICQIFMISCLVLIGMNITAAIYTVMIFVGICSAKAITTKAEEIQAERDL